MQFLLILIQCIHLAHAGWNCNETNCNKLAKVWPLEKTEMTSLSTSSRLIGFSYFCAKCIEARVDKQYSICGKTRGVSNVFWLFLNICWGSMKTWRVERPGRLMEKIGKRFNWIHWQNISVKNNNNNLVWWHTVTLTHPTKCNTNSKVWAMSAKSNWWLLDIKNMLSKCLYSKIRLYRTRLYRNSAYIEVQSTVRPDTMSIQKMIGYIETWIYRSIHHGPLSFDITGLYCTV